MCMMMSNIVDVAPEIELHLCPDLYTRVLQIIGVYQMVARDIFAMREQDNPGLIIGVSYFEIYGGQVCSY